jgi:hypothetical protein
MHTHIGIKIYDAIRMMIIEFHALQLPLFAGASLYTLYL